MCNLVEFKDNKYVADIKLNYIKNIVFQAEKCSKIKYIILFGSALEERCTIDSDIDIAIFGNELRSKILDSKSFHDFEKSVFEYDWNQDYDILYYKDGSKNVSELMQNIKLGLEIYRRKV